MKRKHFLKTGIFGLISTAISSKLGAKPYGKGLRATSPTDLLNTATDYTLPALPYAVDALEPYIDKQTMEIHHGRHHKAYVDNLNKALVGSQFADKSLIDIFKVINKVPTAIRNNGGGHWNHTFFWSILKPNGSSISDGALKAAIEKKWGTIDAFKDEFAKAATGRFGSGWAWLVVAKDKSLAIGSTPNQDNPFMGKAVDINGAPILALDVWEHAYYLKYQNKRADYIKAFWSVANWAEAERLYNEAIK